MPITIKHANHKIFPVTPEKKLALLQLLLEENQDKSIVIFTQDIALVEKAALAHPNLTLLDDISDALFDIVISYEIPSDAHSYLARVAKATQNAYLILLESEQNALYPIEVILGRTIKQEVRDGFGYPQPEPKEEKTFKKPFDKDRKPYDKDKKPYSGERKPYDKDKKPYSGERKPYDGERKPYDKDKKPFDGERKPYDKDRKPYSGEKKPYDKDKKPYDGERKSFDGERKSYSDEKKPYSSEKKPFSHDKKSYDMSKKKSNNFLGYDENGKAKFSGKSGDRNHKYDGSKRGADEMPPKKKPGKTFLIKELKKKEDDK